MNKINILILSAGRRVELVNCFKSAKKELGIDGKIIACDITTTAPAIYFADEYRLVPRINATGFIDAIIEICNQDNIALIVPTIDTELVILAENKQLIESKTNAKVLISSLNVVKTCDNKKLTAKFFKENGFGVPDTLSNADLDSHNYSFPLFIKPLDGSSSINAFKVNNDKELAFFRDYISNPIIQECVSGIEYTIDCFLDFDSNIISVVPRKRLATRSGEILKGEIDLNPKIIDDVTRLLKVLKPIGHITVQGFYGEDEIFRYIEINPRFGGGAPMSIKAGANSPKWLYQLLLGNNIDTNIDIKECLFSRFDDSIMIEND